MVKSGLVGWWPLHEWSGRANDLSGNDNHGTLNGGVTQGVTGIGGVTGYSFDGSDDHIDITGYNSPETYCASAWVRIPSSQTNSVVADLVNNIGGGNRCTLQIGFGSFRIRTGDGTNNSNLRSGVVPKPNRWYHVVAHVNTSGFGKIYVNGKLQNSSNTLNFSSDGNSIRIGATGTSSGGAGFIDGSIVDVRTYKRALSPQEIKHLYQQGSQNLATPPDASDPAAVSRWSFDDRSDTSTAVDEWGSNDGTINGAVYSSDAPRDDSLSMSFDGSDDYIDTPITDINSSFTFSCWSRVKNLESGKYHRLISKDLAGGTEQTMLRVDELGAAALYVYDSDAGTYVSASDSTISEDTWNHIAGTYDDPSGTVKLYVNGTPGAESSGVSTFPSTSLSVTIGADSDGGAQYHNGPIDDARVYNRALSPSEIQQLYRWGSPGHDLRSEVIRR